MKKSRFAEFYSRISQWRGIRAPAENVLLLLPRCLQNDECTANVSKKVDLCKQCGRCDIGELVRLKEKYGFRSVIATGGRQAVEAARKPDIKIIVAVACSKELTLGILSVFPKPVIAVHNGQTNGPCRNTTVSPRKIEEILEKIICQQT
jgi:hypothetical protein